MAELTKVQIIKAAKELNAILGLKNDDGSPGIMTGGGTTKQQISEKIKEAGAFIDPVNDKFTEETWIVLEGLGAVYRVIDDSDQDEKESVIPMVEEDKIQDVEPENTVTEEKQVGEIQEDFLPEETSIKKTETKKFPKWKVMIELIIQQPNITVDQLIEKMKHMNYGNTSKNTANIYIREILFTIESYQKYLIQNN